MRTALKNSSENSFEEQFRETTLKDSSSFGAFSGMPEG
jgi:hypothetical protein